MTNSTDSRFSRNAFLKTLAIRVALNLMQVYNILGSKAVDDWIDKQSPSLKPRTTTARVRVGLGSGFDELVIGAISSALIAGVTGLFGLFGSTGNTLADLFLLGSILSVIRNGERMKKWRLGYLFGWLLATGIVGYLLLSPAEWWLSIIFGFSTAYEKLKALFKRFSRTSTSPRRGGRSVRFSALKTYLERTS